jgi:RNA polymerase sigma factor (sigma-70 family)
MVGRSARAELLTGLNALTQVGVAGNLPDGELLDRFLAGGGKGAEGAFEALVARHGPMVLDVCSNVLRDPHDAQDAFQAAFLVLASRAGSIRRREAVGGWLLGVARRVALQSRTDLARRRAYEGRAAEMRAELQPDRAESWPELHEEIGRLPERFREPVVLCYLEGLSTDAAAARLGCPKGTVLSRLSRARERLHGRLIRRGLAPSTGLLFVGTTPEAIPAGMLSATVRASLCFTKQPAIAAGLSSAAAVSLARGVIYAMMISKLKMLGAAVLICSLAIGGLRAIGMHIDGARAARGNQNTDASERDQETGDPSSVSHVDRLDFGELHVDAIAEAEFGLEFKGIVDPGVSLKIEVPGFANVKNVRLFKRAGDQQGDVGCIVGLALNTKLAGRRTGDIIARLGDQEASVPVVASVVAPEAGQTRVLVISCGFFSSSHRADDNRPWFDLVREAKLDVSYMESLSVPHQSGPPVGGDRLPLPHELAQFEVILLADGGSVFLDSGTSRMIVQLADSGKRVILMASPGITETILQANRILDPLGMQMVDQEIEGPEPGHFRIESANLEADRLMVGVTKLTTFRPARIKISDPKKAKMLAYFPGSRDGFVAVSRHGKGEVVAIGLVNLERWISETGQGVDNARLLKNLLTMKVGQ